MGLGGCCSQAQGSGEQRIGHGGARLVDNLGDRAALVVVGGGGGQRIHQIAPQTGGKVHHHRQKGDNGNGFCYKVALSHGLLGLPFSPSQSETSTARMGMMVEMACL